MKYYVAELVQTAIAFLCALTNHAGACLVWRKLMWLDNWADGVLHPVPQPPPRHLAAPTKGCTCHDQPSIQFTGGYGAASASWHYCPAHGMVRDR